MLFIVIASDTAWTQSPSTRADALSADDRDGVARVLWDDFDRIATAPGGRSVAGHPLIHLRATAVAEALARLDEADGPYAVKVLELLTSMEAVDVAPAAPAIALWAALHPDVVSDRRVSVTNRLRLYWLHVGSAGVLHAIDAVGADPDHEAQYVSGWEWVQCTDDLVEPLIGLAKRAGTGTARDAAFELLNRHRLELESTARGAWCDLAYDDDSALRRLAVGKLGYLSRLPADAEAEAHWSALVAAFLDDPVEEIRDKAADYLWRSPIGGARVAAILIDRLDPTATEADEVHERAAHDVFRPLARGSYAAELVAPFTPYLAACCESADAGLSRQALAILQAFGSAAAPAVPTMTRLAETCDVWSVGVIARALGAIGPAAAPAIPVLRARYASASSDRRASICIALTAIDPTHADTLALLSVALRDDDYRLRRAAADCVTVSGEAMRGEVEWLLAAALEEDLPANVNRTDHTAYRVAAVQALAGIGRCDETSHVIAGLAPVFENPGAPRYLLSAIMRAATELGADPLLDVMYDTYWRHDRAFSETVERAFGSLSADSAPRLMLWLQDDNSGLVLASCEALARVAPTEPAVLDMLLARFHAQAYADPRLRLNAAISAVLDARDLEAELIGAVAPVYLKLLRGLQREIDAGVAGLRRLGALAAGAMAEALAQARQLMERGRLRELLIELAPSIEDVMPLEPGLTAALDNPADAYCRTAALDVLAALGPKAASMAPAVARWVVGAESPVVRWACSTLGAIANGSSTAISAVLSVLRDAPHDSLAREALIAIGSRGPAAVAEVLAPVIDYSAVYVSEAVFVVLQSLGVAGEPCVAPTIAFLEAAVASANPNRESDYRIAEAVKAAMLSMRAIGPAAAEATDAVASVLETPGLLRTWKEAAMVAAKDGVITDATDALNFLERALHAAADVLGTARAHYNATADAMATWGEPGAQRLAVLATPDGAADPSIRLLALNALARLAEAGIAVDVVGRVVLAATGDTEGALRRAALRLIPTLGMAVDDELALHLAHMPSVASDLTQFSWHVSRVIELCQGNAEREAAVIAAWAPWLADAATGSSSEKRNVLGEFVRVADVFAPTPEIVRGLGAAMDATTVTKIGAVAEKIATADPELAMPLRDPLIASIDALDSSSGASSAYAATTALLNPVVLLVAASTTSKEAIGERLAPWLTDHERMAVRDATADWLVGHGDDIDAYGHSLREALRAHLFERARTGSYSGGAWIVRGPLPGTVSPRSPCWTTP